MAAHNNKDKILRFINAIINTQLELFTNDLHDSQIKLTEQKVYITNLLQTLTKYAKKKKNTTKIATCESILTITDKMYTTLMTVLHDCATYKTSFMHIAEICSAIRTSVNTTSCAAKLAVIDNTAHTTQMELIELQLKYIDVMKQYNIDINFYYNSL